jgi:isoquinoline 1-oxidoreductase subunit beta
MPAATEVNRREFIRAGVAGASAFVLGFYLPPRLKTQAAGAAPPRIFKPNAWVRITTDDQITIRVEKPEIGTGLRTSLPMLVAEELEADWSKIRVEEAPAIPDLYHHLGTGGSDGVESSWMYLRKVGAQAREMLLTAAALQWKVEKKDCRAENGTIVHAPTGRRLTYGQLVETARALPEFNRETVPLKDRKDFRFIGKPLPRTDIPAKVDGSAGFGIDVRRPGMLYAAIARCPHFGGKLASLDDSAARSVAGVRQVFPIDPLPRLMNTAGGVAVVADNTWAALQGRAALKITWDKGPFADETTESLRKAAYAQTTARATFVAREEGDPDAALASAVKKVEATYELGFQPHATMETMNATIQVREREIEMWVPTQMPQWMVEELASLAALPPEAVTVHNTFSGGSFGRRGQWDYTAEAYQIGKVVKQPVMVVWSREDDIQHDFYRQFAVQHLEGGLDAQGRVICWKHRVVSTPIRATYDSAASNRDPRHLASQELGGADVVPYAGSNYRVDFAPATSRVPRAWWRSVENSFTGLGVECFIDELAHAAGRDPLDYRLQLLAEDRKIPAVMWTGGPPLETRKLRAVLQLAAEKSGWGRPLPAGHGRGIAGFYSFSSYIAHVVEVSVAADGTVKVQRVVSAVNCGTAVNPDGVKAQIEGAVNFALTPCLSGEITIKECAVEQSNFHDFQVLRLGDSPQIEVHLVPSTEPPTGMGEPGVPPLASAFANAVFAATGKRLRRLPVRAEDLKGS